MKPNMRRNLPGTFLTRRLAQSAWRLSRGEPDAIDVFVRARDPAAAEALRSREVSDIDIEWRAAAAVLALTSAGQPKLLEAQSAIVHEPLARLYDALPPVSLDAQARRLWRRVFRLMRIPGGRYLLGILTCGRDRR